MRKNLYLRSMNHAKCKLWIILLLTLNVSLASASCVISSFPWTEGFESLDSTGAGVVPPCWATQYISGPQPNWRSASAPEHGAVGAHTGTHFMYSSYSSDAWLFTPGMQLTGGTTYYFSYYYALTDAISGFTINTAVGTSQNDTAMTTLIGTLSNPVNTSYKIAYYSYTPASSGVYYFGIESSATNPPYYFNVDDASVTTSSPCVNTSYPWSEGFESISPTGTGNYPPCWTTGLNSGTDWTSASAPNRNGIGAHSGSNYIYSHWSSDTWLYTPGMQLTGGSAYYFTYYYAATDVIAGYTITTAVGTAQDSAGMTTLGIITNPVNTNYLQAVYSFTPPSTGVYYFGIHSACPTSAPGDFNIDDVGIQTNGCPPPVPTVATLVNSTSAYANWTCSGCTGSYIVEYGPSASFTTPGTGDSAGPNGTIVDVNTGTFSTLLSSLTTGTEYRYFIRQNCSGGVYSVNYGSQLFSPGYCSGDLYNTGCTAADYIDNFSLSNLAQTGSGCSANGYGDFSVSQPTIDLIAGASYTWTATYGYGSGEYLKIWIDLNDNGILDDPGELIYDGTTTGANLAGGSCTIPATAIAGNHRLRVRIVYNTTTFGACDMQHEGEVQDYTCNITIPACAIPTSLAASNIGFTSAQANWACSGGCSGSYILEYGPSATFTTPGTGATPGPNGTIITVSTGNTSMTITGLMPGVQYTYYVREDCSGAGNGYSLNSAPQSFITIGTLTATQQFDQVPLGTAGVNILSLSLPLAGNISPLTLNSIKFTSENTNDADIAANGVKLWAGTVSGPVTQIGTAQTFSSGDVTFSGLNLSLATGTTYYFWLTYDISPTATLLDVVDAKINAGDIAFTVGGSSATLPQTLTDPAGNVEIGYCTSLYTTGCGASDYINNFTLSNLSQTGSGCSGTSNTWNAGYGDFTSTEPVIDLIAGATYPWTATYGYGSGEYLKIWIDLNNNGVFTDSGELVYDGTLTGANLPNGIFTLPSSAAAGNRRMRVRICYNVTAFGPCGQYGNGEGEVQDYTCNITVPACTIPTSSSASNINLTSAQANWTCAGGCSGSYIVEYGPAATFTVPGTGLTPGANGTIITVTGGNTSVLITGLTPGIQYTYYVREDCTGASNGYSLNSAAQTFTTPPVITVGTIAAIQQISQVTPGTTGVNILRLDIPVTGSVGALMLNSVKFTSENTNDADIVTNSVKLWTGTVTAPTTQVATSQTFSLGAVTFSGLNISLTGVDTNYFWLTYDISSMATILDVADAKINSGDISFTATGGAVAGIQPPSLLDPAGNVEIGYCTSLYTTGCAAGDYINNFTLSNLDHTGSGCSGTSNTWNAGYGDFTTSEPVINLVAGDPYTWTATYGYPSGEYLKIWIDLNDNGVFTDSGELIYDSTSVGADLASGTFTLSSTAAPGNHRMRVRICYNVTSFGPCGQYGNGEGEVQDYTCSITVPFCAAPTSLAVSNVNLTTAQANWTCTGCTGSYIVEYGPATTFTSPGAGNTPGANGTIIDVPAGNDSLLISGLSPGTQYTYYIRQNCSGSGEGYGNNSAPQNFTTGTPVTLGTIVANQQTGFVSPGTSNVNILRIDLPVTGTVGTLTLNSFKFTSENTNDADIANSGALLWTGTASTPSTQLGSGQSFSSSAVSFANLNMNMVSGTTYLWLTYNISASAISNDSVDAKINTGDISFTASAGAIDPGTVPPSPLNPAGNVIIVAVNCTEPTSLDASNIGLTSNQANWTCTGCTGSYIVEYGPAATFTAPGTGNTPGANGTIINVSAGTDSVLITGLATGTQYTYYVRQNCSGSSENYSNNSAPQEFTTQAPLTLGTVIATQQTGSVPPGTSNVAILRVDMPVTGTVGMLTLNSIKFTSENTNDADIADSGALLWTGTATAPSTQVGTGQTFSSGAVSFLSLAMNLLPDTTYLWLTYNISASAVPNDSVDAKINTGGMVFTASAGATDPGVVPLSPLDPSGNIIIVAVNCTEPTADAASNIGLTSMQANWTCTGCTGSYIVEYGPASTFTMPGTGSAPGTNGTIITVPAGDTSALITSLTPGAQYTYCVRQDCPNPANEFSVNSAAQSATTLSTGIPNLAENDNIGVWSFENRVFVDFSKASKVDAQVQLYDMLGQLMSNEKFGKSTIYNKQLLNTEAAYVIVKVINHNCITIRKVFISDVNK